jgi:hypothetical protein
LRWRAAAQHRWLRYLQQVIFGFIGRFVHHADGLHLNAGFTDGRAGKFFKQLLIDF